MSRLSRNRQRHSPSASRSQRRSPVDVRIEPMRQEDLPEVLAVEVASFGLPWTREMFETDLARRGLAELLVARLAGAGVPPPLAGYICVWTIGEELHVNNLAVDPRWRRRGIASALLAEALDHGRTQGTRRAFLEVRASNVAAQALYRRFGFEATGVRKGYYTHPVEDAVIMTWEAG
jgi:[ribosomal protein S18]-alanine N-acetyltransferase